MNELILTLKRTEEPMHDTPTLTLVARKNTVVIGYFLHIQNRKVNLNVVFHMQTNKREGIITLTSCFVERRHGMMSFQGMGQSMK